MVRWFNPLLFLGGAFAVKSYNDTHVGSYMVFPFFSAIVGPDLDRQAALTYQVLAVVGVLMLIGAVIGTIRDPRRSPPSPPPAG